MWEAIQDWFLSLGSRYGVNPWIFGAIYVGAIPVFTFAITWLVRRARRRESIVGPALLAGFSFISAYLYLIVAGRGVPWWVYAVVVALVVFGAVSTVRKVRRRVAEPEPPVPEG